MSFRDTCVGSMEMGVYARSRSKSRMESEDVDTARVTTRPAKRDGIDPLDRTFPFHELWLAVWLLLFLQGHPH